MRLVSPTYIMNPTIDRVIEFKGLNRNPVIDDGEMREMLNMSCDEYPCLTQRKPRGQFVDEDTAKWEAMDITDPVSIIEKGRLEDGANVKKLAIIDHVGDDYIFKYDGESYPDITISADTRMVAINTRICFFPEKLWFNVQTKEHGSIDASASYDNLLVISDGQNQIIRRADTVTQTFQLADVSQASSGNGITATIQGTPLSGSTVSVRLEMKQQDGTTYRTYARGFKPGNVQQTKVPFNAYGYIWYLTYDGDKTFTLIPGLVGYIGPPPPGYTEWKDKGRKMTITSVEYIPVEADPSGDFTFSMFNEGDVIGINCKMWSGDSSQAIRAYTDLNIPVSVVIKKVEDEQLYIPDGTFLELSQEGVDFVSLVDVTISRECPNLEHVVEYNNRLWGVDNANNEIRASKLGDPTNWNFFQGTAMDSFSATQGTDGEFTGAAAYSNHLLFFKEDYIHKVYGTRPSQYETETATVFGLEKGSHKSVQIVNDTVFYKSRIGMMAYTGGTPFLVSEVFGKDRFKNVISGQDGRKLYCSMQKEDDSYVMMVLDVGTGMWHVEDNVRPTDFCYYNGKLLMVVNGDILYTDADSGETDMPWAAEFGFFDEFIENKKVYSKIRMNLAMTEGSTIVIKIKINDGEWETVNSLEASSYFEENTIVVPRRCDRYSIRLEGTGKVQIRSLTRQYRQGTDRRDVM